MNRRAFLSLLSSGAAGAVLGAELDLDRLLWVPKPIITVPAMPTTLYVHPRLMTEADFKRIIAEAAKGLADHIDAEAIRLYYGGMRAKIILPPPVYSSRA